MGTVRKILLFVAWASVAAVAQGAPVLLSTSFSKNFPLGPFKPNESIEIWASLTNTSADQTITICEGPCIGDSLTYSLGGQASLPDGYSFFFGDKRQEDVFDGQVEGALAPGATVDFIFGMFVPNMKMDPGLYAFRTQLQIFDATADRLMLASPTLAGQWEVRAMPEPSTLALAGFAVLALVRSRVGRQRIKRSPIDGTAARP
jgi:hypothetical protein